MNYEQMVKALTCGNDGKLPCHNNKCQYWVDQWHGIGLCNVIKKDADAAAAIEDLQRDLSLADIAADDNERQIEELQAKLEQCTLFNTDLLNMREMSKEEADEILEYILNAPVGPIEPMQIEQLPKRGEWIPIQIGKWRGHKCSCCGIAREVPCSSSDGIPQWKYCPDCGAKMEVRE